MANGPEHTKHRRIIRRAPLGSERVSIWTPLPFGEMLDDIAHMGSDVQPFYYAGLERFDFPDRRVFGVTGVNSDVEVTGFPEVDKSFGVLTLDRPEYFAWRGRLLTNIHANGQPFPAEMRFVLVQTTLSQELVSSMITKKRLDLIKSRNYADERPPGIQTG